MRIGAYLVTLIAYRRAAWDAAGPVSTKWVAHLRMSSIRVSGPFRHHSKYVRNRAETVRCVGARLERGGAMYTTRIRVPKT